MARKGGSHNFEVESVVDRRMIPLEEGIYQREYLTKWKNFPASQNTWEPTDSFQGGRRKIQDFKSRRDRLIDSALTHRVGESTVKKSDLEEIIAAGREDSQGYLVIKLKGREEARVVSLQQAQQLVPHLVTAYYQARLLFQEERDS